MRPKARPLTPNPVQAEGIECGHQHFEQNDRGTLVASCGSGKTLMSIKIVETFDPPARKVLIAVPTRLLLKQTMEDWAQNFMPEKTLEFVAVCSDQGVKGDLSNDELERLGIRVTTSPEELEQELTRVLPSETVQVVISTYSSLPVVSEAQKGHRYEAQFDIIIADEAHHTAGESAKTKKSRAYQTLHSNKEIRAARRLHMTATPRVVAQSTGNRKKDKEVLKSFGVQEKEVYSMDDREIYGRTFYELTLAQAIDNEIVPVAPYQVVPHFVRKSDLDFVRDPENQTEYAELDAQTALNLYVLSDLMAQHPEYGATHAITYHRLKKDAKELQAALRLHSLRRQEGAPRFHAAYLDGDMKMEHRKDVLTRFSQGPEEDLNVLSNAKALTEGLNVPGANALMFADGKSSVVEIMQAIGRIIRMNGEQDKVGTVVVPILVDDRDPENPVVDAESEKRLRQILFAGKLVDSKIASRIERPELNSYGALPHPKRTFGGNRYMRIYHEEAGWLAGRAVGKVVDRAVEDLKPIAGRDYFGVEWNQKTGEFRARIKNPWYATPERNPFGSKHGSGPWIDLGSYPEAESAAAVVDDFIREGKLDWETNFGRNEHRVEKEPRKRVTSRFPGKISYSRTRDDHCAYLHIVVNGEDGQPITVRPGVYFKTEAEAIAAHNALVERYGEPDRMIMGENGPVEPDYSLLAGRLKRRYPKGEEPVCPEGVEEDPYYCHGTPEKRFWAYARHADGSVVPVGYFASVEAAQAGVLAKREELNAEPTASQKKRVQAILDSSDPEVVETPSEEAPAKPKRSRRSS